MRKIKNDEIENVAKIMAESFVDYPLYAVFFPDDSKKLTRVFYFFWFRVYTRREFTYITPENDFVVSEQRPEDHLRSSLPLLLNPRFLFGFIKNIPIKSLLLVMDFSKMEEAFWKKYYDPQRDCYVQAICALKEAKGHGQFFRALKELDDGRPVFCETHTERNVRLYELMGLHVCDKATWHGVTHYVMRRD